MISWLQLSLAAWRCYLGLTRGNRCRSTNSRWAILLGDPRSCASIS